VAPLLGLTVLEEFSCPHPTSPNVIKILARNRCEASLICIVKKNSPEKLSRKELCKNVTNERSCLID
jgi:hypothetical protein